MSEVRIQKTMWYFVFVLVEDTVQKLAIMRIMALISG